MSIHIVFCVAFISVDHEIVFIEGFILYLVDNAAFLSQNYFIKSDPPANPVLSLYKDFFLLNSNFFMTLFSFSS